MTTEDDFWRMLEADPTDWNTRLILADFLEDKDDPRSMGLRAVVSAKRCALRCVMEPVENEWALDEVYWILGSWRWIGEVDRKWDQCRLHHDWYEFLTPNVMYSGYCWMYYNTLKEAESDAALAFLKLPRQRQLELLGQVEVVG